MYVLCTTKLYNKYWLYKASIFLSIWLPFFNNPSKYVIVKQITLLATVVS